MTDKQKVCAKKIYDLVHDLNEALQLASHEGLQSKFSTIKMEALGTRPRTHFDVEVFLYVNR